MPDPTVQLADEFRRALQLNCSKIAIMFHSDYNASQQDYKTITVAKLIEILQTMPSEWELWANDVRNLNLGDGKLWQGYIDIGDEVFYPSKVLPPFSPID